MGRVEWSDSEMLEALDMVDRAGLTGEVAARGLSELAGRNFTRSSVLGKVNRIRSDCAPDAPGLSPGNRTGDMGARWWAGPVSDPVAIRREAWRCAMLARVDAVDAQRLQLLRDRAPYLGDERLEAAICDFADRVARGRGDLSTLRDAAAALRRALASTGNEVS